ncbi:MAG: hypothetical protein P4L84_10550 [Isosphaeraceae bacterium]|nr:hypothetical protein [Isosphaeraceae bacterium]
MPMRSAALVGLSAVVLSLLAHEARAQQGYFNRTSVARSPDREELTPYRSRTSTGASANGEYRRARPEPPARSELPRAAAVPRNYFPGLPSGVGPNRNTVNPAHLCVPGRRAFLMGR